MEENNVRNNDGDNTQNKKPSLYELQNKYSHINFNKTFIQIPGKTNFISLSEYINDYYDKNELQKYNSLNLFFHGFRGGFTKKTAKTQNFEQPVIALGWNGYSTRKAKMAATELAYLLNNELPLKKDSKLYVSSASTGNVAAGKFISKILDQKTTQPSKISILLQKIAKTSFWSSLFAKAKSKEILQGIKTEDLAQMNITTPNIENNTDKNHSQEAVKELYDDISKRILGRELSYKEIYNIQDLQKEFGIMQALKIAQEQMNNLSNQPQQGNSQQQAQQGNSQSQTQQTNIQQQKPHVVESATNLAQTNQNNNRTK